MTPGPSVCPTCRECACGGAPDCSACGCAEEAAYRAIQAIRAREDAEPDFVDLYFERADAAYARKVGK